MKLNESSKKKLRNKFFLAYLLIIILILLIFNFGLNFLNFKYSGVPIYQTFGITLQDLKSHYNQKDTIYNQKNSLNIENEYLNYFSKYKNEDYFKFYKKTNNVTEIKKLSGVDLNVFFFNDKNGCRENKSIDYLKTDYVLLGDSFLWGVAINNPFDIAGQLRNNFSKNLFLNLGVPGTGPPYQIELLKKIKSKSDFKNIIWFFYEGNDYQESTITNVDTDISCNFGYENKNEEFILINNEFDNYNYFLGLKIYLSNYLRGLNSFLKLFKNYENDFNLNERDYNLVLAEAKKFLDSKKVEKRIIYYIPSYTYQSFNKNIYHPQLNKISLLKEKVKKIALQNGFEFLDGNIYLNKIDDSLNLYHYRYPTHLNSLGYKLIASQISDYLKNN